MKNSYKVIIGAVLMLSLNYCVNVAPDCNTPSISVCFNTADNKIQIIHPDVSKIPEGTWTIYNKSDEQFVLTTEEVLVFPDATTEFDLSIDLAGFKANKVSFQYAVCDQESAGLYYGFSRLLARESKTKRRSDCVDYNIVYFVVKNGMEDSLELKIKQLFTDFALDYDEICTEYSYGLADYEDVASMKINCNLTSLNNEQHASALLKLSEMFEIPEIGFLPVSHAM